jgi:type II secretory pathway pseudopilin PulG
LLSVLLLLALAALAALAGAEVWATTMRQERERELLFVGDQYRRAIESYWRASPGPVKVLPTSIEDMLADRRFPMPVRHLRRAWRDPLAEGGELTLIRVGNGIAGVHSTSDAVPLKQRGFPERYREFERAASYRDWRFEAELPKHVAARRQAAAQGGP